jgi:SNF2 family DNA or RNA helicase
MYDYKFRPEMEGTLADFMQHRSISYASSECQSLPPVTRIVEEVRLPEDAAAYYQKAIEAIIAAKGNYNQAKNIFLRMRQLSSGFIGFTDDETGAKAKIVFPVNPKLDRLLELIEDMPLDRKFVVFHEFTHSGQVVSEAIKKMGIGCGWLWGGTKDSRSILDRFDNSKKMRGLVVNTKLGAMVLNLQIANYEYVYESPVSVIDREQMDKRLFREGQECPGFLYDLVAKGTVDAKILQFHREGDDLLKALLRDPYGIVG